MMKATFTSSCFWHMQPPFGTLVSGYNGRLKLNPSYEMVSSGTTGHIGSPVVQIGDEFIFRFDLKKLENLLI